MGIIGGRLPEPGSIHHLDRLVRKIEGQGYRPRLSHADKAVLSSIIKQEIYRRKLALSDRTRWLKLGINLANYEFPDWIKYSKKKG
jgi:hypothetical protein